MNPRRRTGPLALGTALALALLSGVLATTNGGIIATQAQSDCTRTLSPDQSIQSAIDKAESGAVVCLGEGRWEEPVTIGTDLTLRGAGMDKTEIVGGFTSVVVTVASDNPINVALTEFAIPSGGTAMELSGQAHVNMTRVRITGNGRGMRLADSAQATIRDSTVSQNDLSNGIELRGSAQVEIRNSTVSKNGGIGIKLEDTTQLGIRDSTVSKNDADGIRLADSAEASIRDNRIVDNIASGIVSRSEGNVEGAGNVMSGNGVALMGNVPGSLREPLVEATEDQIVYPTDAYPTLQHAVDALRPGGKLLLQGGTHTAGVTITKELLIRGQDGPTFQASDSSLPVLSLVGGAALTAHALEVKGGDIGLMLGADAQATIRESTVSQNGSGIVLSNSAQAEVQGSTVTENEDVGIGLANSAEATIRSTTVSKDETGIALSGSAQTTIRDSTVSENDDEGIFLADSAEATVRDSAVTKNTGQGIRLLDTAQAAVLDSTVSANESDPFKEEEAGILLAGSAQATIRDSTVADNTANGIALKDAAEATIRANRITGNPRSGIFSTSEGNVEGSGNVIRENGIALVGNVPGNLREPLVEATKERVMFPNENYPTLQHALDALQPGGTLILQGGTHTAGATIAKDLTLQARDGATLQPGDSSSGAPLPALSLVGGAALTADALDVTGGSVGLVLGADAQTTIRDSRVSENINGISIFGSAKAIIRESSITKNERVGIRLAGLAQAEIRGSTVSENSEGIKLEDTAEATIRTNRITGNVSGIVSTSQGDVAGTGNVMRNNGIALRGNVPGSLRKPLVEATEKRIVFPNENYPTLQHAIDALQPGGELILQGGTHKGGLTIAKKITLRAQNGATLRTPGFGLPALSLVEDAALTAERLEVTAEVVGSIGLALGANARATVRDSTVSEHDIGILLGGSSEATIRGSTISENNVGIQLRDSAQAVIRDNSITNNRRGVVLVEAPCEDTDETFTGVLEGGANTFDDNEEGAVCPDELEFLMTEEGGELDRRE